MNDNNTRTERRFPPRVDTSIKIFGPIQLSKSNVKLYTPAICAVILALVALMAKVGVYAYAALAVAALLCIVTVIIDLTSHEFNNGFELAKNWMAYIKRRYIR